MDAPSIQWFPGHMAKTRRLMKESLPLVDAVVEMIDARIPRASRNPEMDRLVGKKPRIVLLNKSDLADESATREWLAFFREHGIAAMAADSRSGKGLKAFLPLLRTELKELSARRAARGMQGKPLRAMVVGIPNTGKSSFINRMAGGKRAQVGDRPGVTRGAQWVSPASDVELLDMPGVLWPKFEDKRVAEHLAFTGAIKDDIMDIEALAMRLLEVLHAGYPQALETRYKLPSGMTGDGPSLLTEIARRRGMLLPGAEVDITRAAVAVLDEFRGGQMGRITLERPSAGRRNG